MNNVNRTHIIRSMDISRATLKDVFWKVPLFSLSSYYDF